MLAAGSVGFGCIVVREGIEAARENGHVGPGRWTKQGTHKVPWPIFRKNVAFYFTVFLTCSPLCTDMQIQECQLPVTNVLACVVLHAYLFYRISGELPLS